MSKNSFTLPERWIELSNKASAKCVDLMEYSLKKNQFPKHVEFCKGITNQLKIGNKISIEQGKWLSRQFDYFRRPRPKEFWDIVVEWQSAYRPKPMREIEDEDEVKSDPIKLDNLEKEIINTIAVAVDSPNQKTDLERICVYLSQIVSLLEERL